MLLRKLICTIAVLELFTYPNLSFSETTNTCFTSKTESVEKVRHDMEREKDETKLRSWLKEAVEANHAALIHQIGREFLEKKDYANAFKWYEKGVPLGDYQAMYDLGVMWMNGEGREKNLSKAYAWFLLTAEYIPTNWDDYFFPPQMIEWHKKLPEKISKNMTSQEVDAGNIYYQEQKEKVICNWYNWYGHYIMTKDKRP